MSPWRCGDVSFVLTRATRAVYGSTDAKRDASRVLYANRLWYIIEGLLHARPGVSSQSRRWRVEGWEKFSGYTN